MDVYLSLALCELLLLIDALQTRYIAQNPTRFYETNVILGKHPRLGAVNVYFIVCAVVVATVAIMCPRAWGLGVSIGVSIIEAICIVGNHRLGIKME